MNKIILIILLLMIGGCDYRKASPPAKKEVEYNVRFIISKSIGGFYGPRSDEEREEQKHSPLLSLDRRMKLWNSLTVSVKDEVDKLGAQLNYVQPTWDDGSQLHYICLVADLIEEKSRCAANNRKIVSLLQNTIREVGPGYYIYPEIAIDFFETTRKLKESEVDKIYKDEEYRKLFFCEIIKNTKNTFTLTVE